MILADECINMGAKIFWYLLQIIFVVNPKIRANIIFIGFIWIRANIIDVINIEVRGLLNFFNLLYIMYLNIISSQIGPIIPDVINSNMIFVLVVIDGDVKIKIIIFNRHDRDIPKDISG